VISTSVQKPTVLDSNFNNQSFLTKNICAVIAKAGNVIGGYEFAKILNCIWLFCFLKNFNEYYTQH
jgi:hypothetical protein